MKYPLYALIIVLISSCMPESGTTSTSLSTIEKGAWKFSFFTQNYEIPIRAIIENDSIKILNADETVTFSIDFEEDSFFIDIPNYDSHLEGIIQSSSSIKGVFVKDYVEDYSIPFIAIRSDGNVFETSDNTTIKIKEKYDVLLIDGEDISPAIGIFDQRENIVFASIATETGDYRYLEGVLSNDRLMLSTFDGSRLYLLTASIKNDSIINGKFISGKSGNYKWLGNYNPEAQLKDPEKLTYLKEGYKDFDVSFIDLDKKMTDLNAAPFQNKVRIIQIMGTWCSNCLDETRYFNTLYSRYKDKGLEIIAVAFENGNDTTIVLEKLKRYKINNDIKYTLLYGGKNGSSNAELAFPMLNKIMSFPTAIYLDASNNVRKIYTGFYGPGTGEYFVKYSEENEMFIESLLEEINK